MGDKSKIEWLRGGDGSQGASWNAIRARNKATGGVGHFCVHKTAACKNCYAERLQPRFRNDVRYAAQDRDKVELFLDATKINEPLGWKRPRLIFVCSMTDLFLEDHPDAWVDRHFEVMAAAKQHIFIVLTKRGARLRSYMTELAAHPERLGAHVDPADPKTITKVLHPLPLPNVWTGVSCHDQASADEIVPQLRATPAAVRFISAEPLLGPIDLRQMPLHSAQPTLPPSHRYDALKGGTWDLPTGILNWVIAGGESGSGARPMHPDWVRSLRDQCAAVGVPFFFKQWGEYLPVGQSLPGCGKIHGGTAVKPGRMKLHYGGTPEQGPKYAFAERGVAFTSTGDGRLTFCIGKHGAGRLLDGREHNGMPAPAAAASQPELLP